MKVNQLKLILEKYPDAEVGFFDDNADEYGDFDGDVLINIDRIDTYPLTEDEKFIYILPDVEIKITDSVVD
jgi:hypothetical protein|tara:strand:+ start:206 stop:418 length:213 start_codon:yes stop_codon:yes gene_type:complete